MPIVSSAYTYVAGDDWGSPFNGGPVDRLDITAYNGPALVQFRVDNGWQPADGILVRKGLFRSMPGLVESYRSIMGVRFKRATPGNACSIDFEAWSV